MNTNQELKHRIFRVWRRHSGLIVLASVLSIAAAGWLLHRVVDSWSPQQRISETAAAADSWTFDHLLEVGNVQQLNRRLFQEKDASGDEIVVQLERLGKIIALADRMIELQSDESDQQSAIREKLSALIERLKLAFENDFSDPAYVQELSDFANQYAEANDPRIVQLARTGRIVATISSAVETANAADRKRRLETAALDIESTNDATKTPIEDILVLHDSVQFASQQLAEKECAPLMAAFVAAFSGTNREDVDKLVSRMAAGFGRSEFDLVDFMNALPIERSDAIDRFVDQVHRLLQQNGPDEQILASILEQANQLLALGKDDIARTILDRVAAIPTNRLTGVRAQIETLTSRLQLFRQPLATTAFLDLEENPFELTSSESALHMLFFFSSDDKRNTLREFSELVARFKSLIDVDKLEIVAVYLDDGHHEADIADIKVAASRDVKWRACLVKSASDQGREFLQQAALGSLPYMLVLDHEGKVVSHGTTPQIAEEIMYAR